MLPSASTCSYPVYPCGYLGFYPSFFTLPTSHCCTLPLPSTNMSSKEASTPAKWELVSKKKKAEQDARIPADWRLSTLPGPEVHNYTEIPRQCGLLTQDELQITEKYDAVALAAAIREKRLKCLDVARAFCKVSVASWI